MSTAFLGPLVRPGVRNHRWSGSVLGAHTTQPLGVSVEVVTPGLVERRTVVTKTGHLLEALAQVAAERRQEMSYRSRGDSTYLDQFLGLPNAGRGHWDIRLNGQEVIDLAAAELTAGDTMLVSWVLGPKP